MTYEEKRSWIRLTAAVLGYGGYLAAVLAGLGDRPLAEARYAPALLFSLAVAVIAGAAATGVLAVRTPRPARATDERDREIGRFGDHVGQAFVVIGALAAMGMAIAGTAAFWIANVIYLGFALSAIAGGAARVAVYRTGVPRW